MSMNKKMPSVYLGLIAILGMVFSAAAHADAPAPVLNSGDTAWMLTSTALVLLMTIPGVALFYGGMVRRKNLLSVAAATFATTALISVVWAVVGYSLAFKGTGAYVGDFSAVFLKGMGFTSLTGTIPESVFMTFQMTFAIITPALIIGAIVERMKFSALLIFMAAWSILVYSPIAHMVWGGGWLMGDGVQDFAGGTVVHINAGVAGLVAALMLGKRKGYGTEPMPPVNLVYTMAGAALLWVGWFGFNAGSAAAANQTAGMAMAVTQIATAVAAMSWMLIEWIMRGKPTLLGMASGAVAGLVAITPASGFVGPIGAFAIGIAAGIIPFLASVYLKRLLGYDDSLDAFGVHAVGGIVGALMTGIFSAVAFGGVGVSANANGSILAQFLIQAKGVGFTIIYDAVVTFAILMVLKMTIGLRVTEEEEAEGLDINQHGERV
ncbi:MAG: ammonia channel protein [Halothiobacillus sp. 24-54-40]|nr:MAG: ammonia channel protein [Halothiobacillus sp. 35-54-62]OYY52194.1 MAG: ammonia channel protein [Halothiobacillus sp. 28-55-5]OYZ85400.1 MAG: ammonia channel protein [Halothiobacillus sp. 24-54-40]OZA78840.1 MAG: ammonia channel protein [Halothiobacillus sp. 39-53-45]HQS03308.1 ammonium transporter [Halothiobacillus sp.]